jgi:CRISPR-associated protein (TIGR03986 family)
MPKPKPITPPWKQDQKDARKQERAEKRRRREQAVMTTAVAEQAKSQGQQFHLWPPAHQATESRDQYRFLNPYNFVRYLPASNPPADDADAQLLARCAPPPHDRYVGLTGRVVCRLAAVTPLFISDSHDVRVTTVTLADGRQVEHKSYRFFQYDGKDTIPASSLRGMIRSVFEAVTNAPFSVFDGDERLEYRLDPAEARRFKPGIVQSLPEDDQPGTIAFCDEAKIAAYYQNDDSMPNLMDDSWTCGEEAYAIVGKTKNNIPKVELLARDPWELTADGRPVRHGWVKVTGQTIDTKRNESFFYFIGDPAKAKTIAFDVEREKDFNTILQAQLHERREDFHSQVQHERLTVGDLVYVERDPEDPAKARNIALARVARLRYRNAIGDLLPDHLKPSERYDQLDVASRVFGWVKATPTDDRTARVAYAGRVRFSHATLTTDGDKGVYKDELALAILGEPKPTTTLFYLHKAEGAWSEAERKEPNAAETIGYDGPNRLRGRKVYRHHGAALDREEYERAERRRDHQNRSVRGVRAPGNVFEFTIDFHNLAPVELGALIWVLQTMGVEGCCHRLGYAKPLGFGSVRVHVSEVRLLDMATRYEDFDLAAGWRQAQVDEMNDWMRRFEGAMAACYGRPLRKLENIHDLFALLREPGSSLPQHIHYPRSRPRPDPEGKNFEWFVGNKGKSKKLDRAGPNLVLEIAAEEKTGLPLIEKKERR